MRIRLKPVEKQVIVITRACSRTGCRTAHTAAMRGARLVLAAREEAALRTLATALRHGGTDVVTVAADAARPAEVERIVGAAMKAHGRIDSWINIAAPVEPGELLGFEGGDHHAAFDAVYWGTVYGSLAAVRQMQHVGGAIINVGSVLGDCTVPTQGAHAAASHAMKAFTETLRLELGAARIPISVSLIKPASIATNEARQPAGDLLAVPRTRATRHPADRVADAVVYACEYPRRVIRVGGRSRTMAAMSFLAPRFYARSVLRQGALVQKRDEAEIDAGDRRARVYAREARAAKLRPARPPLPKPLQWPAKLLATVPWRPRLSAGLATGIATGAVVVGLISLI